MLDIHALHLPNEAPSTVPIGLALVNDTVVPAAYGLSSLGDGSHNAVRA